MASAASAAVLQPRGMRHSSCWLAQTSSSLSPVKAGSTSQHCSTARACASGPAWYIDESGNRRTICCGIQLVPCTRKTVLIGALTAVSGGGAVVAVGGGTGGGVGLREIGGGVGVGVGVRGGTASRKLQRRLLLDTLSGGLLSSSPSSCCSSLGSHHMQQAETLTCVSGTSEEEEGNVCAEAEVDNGLLHISQLETVKGIVKKNILSYEAFVELSEGVEVLPHGSRIWEGEMLWQSSLPCSEQGPQSASALSAAVAVSLPVPPVSTDQAQLQMAVAFPCMSRALSESVGPIAGPLLTRRKAGRSLIRQASGDFWGINFPKDSGWSGGLLPRRLRHADDHSSGPGLSNRNNTRSTSKHSRDTGRRRWQCGCTIASLTLGEQGRESDATSDEGGGAIEPAILGKGLADMRWTRMAFFWKRSKPYDGRVGTYMKEGNVAMASWGLKSRKFRQPPSADRAKALSALLPYVVLATGAAALIYPPSYSWFSKQYYTPALGGIMLSIGIQLKPSDFLLAIRRPKPVLLGYGVQYVIKPFLGYALAYLFNVPPVYAAGFILTSCVSGAQLSSYATYLSEGDVAFSIVLTAVTTISSVVVTPLLSKFLIGAVVPVDVVAMSKAIMQVVVAPIMLGFFLNTYAKPVVDGIRNFMPMLAMVCTSLCIGSPLALNQKMLISRQGLNLLLPVLAFHILSFASGYWVPKMSLWRQEEKIARTMSICSGMQSSTLAMLLATQFLGFTHASPPSYSVVIMAIMGLSIGSFWGRGGSIRQLLMSANPLSSNNENRKLGNQQVLA